jgi:hypothetical protein
MRQKTRKTERRRKDTEDLKRYDIEKDGLKRWDFMKIW